MPSNNGKIVPVVLAGGAGTRLWPLSRTAYPKQLIALTGAAQVDVSSGVEDAPGDKSCEKIRAFIAAAQRA